MADNTTLNAGSGGDVISTDDLTTLNNVSVSGVKMQRVKLCYGSDGEAYDIASDQSSPLPVGSCTAANFTRILYATNVAAGTTAIEAMVTLTNSGADGFSPSTGTTHHLPTAAARRYKITTIALTLRGHATATAATIVATFRCNTAGSVVTTSPPFLQLRAAVPATALAVDRVVLNFGDVGPELFYYSSGNMGVSVLPTFTTNAPTYDIQIVGYESTNF